MSEKLLKTSKTLMWLLRYGWEQYGLVRNDKGALKTADVCAWFAKERRMHLDLSAIALTFTEQYMIENGTIRPRRELAPKQLTMTVSADILQTGLVPNDILRRIKFAPNLMCYGGIIFNTNNNNKILLVKNPKKNLWGFPKGCKEAGDKDIPFLTAVREVWEETGIQPQDLLFDGNNVVCEEYFKLDSDRLVVSYFIATASESVPLHAQDPTEDQPEWMLIDDALRVLPDKRRWVLEHVTGRTLPATKELDSALANILEKVKISTEPNQ